MGVVMKRCSNKMIKVYEERYILQPGDVIKWRNEYMRNKYGYCIFLKQYNIESYYSNSNFKAFTLFSGKKGITNTPSDKVIKSMWVIK